jgi:hypothetical protein
MEVSGPKSDTVVCDAHHFTASKNMAYKYTLVLTVDEDEEDHEKSEQNSHQ